MTYTVNRGIDGRTVNGGSSSAEEEAERMKKDRERIREHTHS
jgi:hypothetical protein